MENLVIIVPEDEMLEYLANSQPQHHLWTPDAEIMAVGINDKGVEFSIDTTISR